VLAIATLRSPESLTGQLDTSFSGDGKTTVAFDLGGINRVDQATAVAIGRDGKIFVGGSAFDSAVNASRIGLTQLLPSGGTDLIFCVGSCNLQGAYTAIHSGRRVSAFDMNAPKIDLLTTIALDRTGRAYFSGTTPGTQSGGGPNTDTFFAQRFEDNLAPGANNWGNVGPSNSAILWDGPGGGPSVPAKSSIDPQGRILLAGNYKAAGML